MGGLKEETKKGVIWSAIERFSVQGVHFLFMIFMARILSPDDYGLVGMLTIFMSLAQVLIDSGFSQALIRKQDRTEVDKSTVFFFNIAVGVVLYLFLFIVAQFIADFYNQPVLTPLTRVIGLSVIINSLAVVQRATLTIKIDFKTQAKAAFVAALLSGCVGLYFAYNGYGAWALVYQQLSNLSINVVLLWILGRWLPALCFSWASFKELFGFGSKMLASGLLDTIWKNIYPIVIGKLFAANALGHYTRAVHFAQFPSSNITGIMQRVTYPVLCKIQDEDERLASVYRRFLKISAFVIFPLMMLLSGVSIPLLNVVVGEQWYDASIYLMIMCFSMMWYPVHAINLNLLQVKGRSDLFLRLEIIKKVVGVIVLFVTYRFGVMTMCFGGIVSSYIALVINTFYTGKLINVGFFRQMSDLLPILLLSFAVFGVSFSSTLLFENKVLQLIVGLSIGGLMYLGTSYLLKFDELKEVKELMLKKN